MVKKKLTISTLKRKLNEILAELPTKDKLSSRLQLNAPSSHTPRLQLPNGLDFDRLYVIFTLFISEEIVKYIRQSTNQYA